jgi:imidazolonepropionase-like amidohydrolase
VSQPTLRILALGLLTAVALPAAAASHAIVHATAHTITKGVIEDATIVIRDGRIAAIGKGLAPPAGATVVDAKGRPVTPGLFDALGALGVLEVELEDSTVDRGNGDPRYSAAFMVADGFNPRSPKIAITRIEGVTRALVAPVAAGGDGVSSVIAGQAATIHLGLGDQLLLDTRAALIVYYGEGGKALAGGARGAVLLQLREALDDARDFARNRASYDAGARRSYARGRLDLEALQPVLRRELPVVFHVERASDILKVLEFAKAQGLRAVIAGGAEAWMVAAELARADVPVILDTVHNLPAAFEALGATLTNAGRLQEAGVAVAFATEDVGNPRNVKQLAGNAVANGMDYEAALAGLTRVPARIFGMTGYGSLEVGQDADVVVWSGDPLEVTTYADVVFVRGEPVPMGSRQTELRDRYRDLGKAPWPPAYRR